MYIMLNLVCKSMAQLRIVPASIDNCCFEVAFGRSNCSSILSIDSVVMGSLLRVKSHHGHRWLMNEPLDDRLELSGWFNTVLRPS